MSARKPSRELASNPKRASLFPETVASEKPDVRKLWEPGDERPKPPAGMPVLPEDVMQGPPERHRLLAHMRFLCRLCKRQLGGCLRTCDHPIEEHKVESVDCCSVCRSKAMNHKEGSDED